MVKASTATTKNDAQAVVDSIRSAYKATPTNLKIIDLYVAFAVFTAVIQVWYVAFVGSFPFNSFLSGFLSCVGTAVLAVCLRIQVNKENKEFKDLPPERAFADFVLCNLVLHLAEKEIGERRVISYHGAGLSVAPKIDYNESIASSGDPEEAKEAYSQALSDSICQHYYVCKTAVHGTQGLEASTNLDVQNAEVPVIQFLNSLNVKQ